MARKKPKGTRLNVFSGREAKLNRAIFQTLRTKKPLTSYDTYLEIRKIKGLRHIKRQNVDRRVKALYQQHWLETSGVKTAKAHFLSPLYALSLRAQSALALDQKDLNAFLQTADELHLAKLFGALSSSEL